MEELTDEQIEELHGELEELVEELELQLHVAKHGSRPVDLDEPIGRLSRMEAMQQQQMTSAHRRRIEIRLQQAKAALNRYQRDEYGYCNACDEPIGYKRLSVKPESPLCVHCQSSTERR
jgi:DnaK suppressor protein